MYKDTHGNRISKFIEFLTESQVIEFLLEGNLMASSRFLNRLSTITANPIATTLFKAFSGKVSIEKDLPQNWVDVTDKEDSVSFMPDRLAARSENNPNIIYTSPSRSEVKIGRLARAILTELGSKFTDQDIEVFVNAYKSAKIEENKNLKLVSGIAIKKYYLQSNYSILKGQLGGSCMRYDNCQRYFRIYSKNTESCQLLVYVDESDKVLGRALVWKIFKKELYTITQSSFECEAEYFMDRVYTANDSDINRFISYAKEKGWLYKYRMNSDEKLAMVFKYNNESTFGRIIIKLQRGLFTNYPYVDTLTFSNGDDMISNVGFTTDDSEDPDEGFLMCDTDGDSHICDRCHGSGYEHRHESCQKCYGKGQVYCPECQGGGSKICKKCEGNGTITCANCNGQGSNTCTYCNGQGAILCVTCAGARSLACNTCHGDGNIGICTNCNGDGDLECTECKGVPLICKICEGKKKIVRKWGNGMRTVICPGCAGIDGAITGTRKHSGCRCGTCSRSARIDGDNFGWRNIGRIACGICRGNGNIKCSDCGGFGRISCETCKGVGSALCTHCKHGRVICGYCDGNGSTEMCSDCSGTGKLGKCENCTNGLIKCDRCDGTGKTPEDAPKELCNKCAGILNKLKSEISKSGFNRAIQQ